MKSIVTSTLAAVPFVAASLSFTAALPASAQVQVGLINVNVSDVIDDIAVDLNVNVSQIPVTVQAPIGVAANVCGLQVITILSQQLTECDAETTSRAFNRIVQRQLIEQEA